jgi:hypothetical protein
MFKLAALVVSILVERVQHLFRSPTLMILEKVADSARSIVLMLVSVIVSTLLLTSGVVLAVMEISIQYDRTGYVIMSATLIGAIALIVVPLIVLGVVMAPKRWAAFKMEPEAPPRHLPSLEESIGLIFSEFLKHRSETKQHATAAARPAPRPQADGKFDEEVPVQEHLDPKFNGAKAEYTA